MEHECNEEILVELMEQIHRLHKENAKLIWELDEAKKYADDLVEHSNMPCLPADLRNLRQANEHFAVENAKLRQEIDRLESYNNQLAKINLTLAQERDDLNVKNAEINRKLKSIQALFL